MTSAVTEQVSSEMIDRSILQNRGTNVLTSEETNFFNKVVTDGGFTDESILPITTQERVFEDLVEDHLDFTGDWTPRPGTSDSIYYSGPDKGVRVGSIYLEIFLDKLTQHLAKKTWEHSS